MPSSSSTPPGQTQKQEEQAPDQNQKQEREVANAALAAYNRLPARGKPGRRGKTQHTWTVLAAIVLERAGRWTCVALGTGVKCLNHRSVSSDALTDSHAEVVCRRAFLLYMYHELAKVHKGQASDLFEERLAKDIVRLRNDTRVHMYISHAPCGDASMSHLAEAQESDVRDQRTAHKRRKYDDAKATVVHGRELFDAVGILRTKPGRGDAVPSHSYSCSDKIAKWNYLGLQGSLLMTLVDRPVYPASIIIGDYYERDSAKRALCGRLVGVDSHADIYRANLDVLISQPSAEVPLFQHGKQQLLCDYEDSNLVTADISILWYKGSDKPEYLIGGRREGAAPGKQGQYGVKTRSQACKRSLWQLHRRVAATLSLGATDKKTLAQAKQQSTDYQQAKQKLYATDAFRGWQGNDAALDDFYAE